MAVSTTPTTSVASPRPPVSSRRPIRTRLPIRVGSHPGLAVLLLPSLVLIGALAYYPAVKSLIGGFYAWNGFSAPKYVGLSQFSTYLRSSLFTTEARNLLILFIGYILIAVVVQFSAAELVIHLRRKAATFAKYALVIPIVIPPVILIDVWAYLFAPTDGLLNAILQHLHLPQPLWLGDPNIALLSILLVGFPWVSGIGFLIFLGGLQNLPRETLEASALDGVGSLRRIFAIDAPLVLPQFRVVVVLSGIAAIQNFIPILLLTDGGPSNSTMVPGLDMYQSAFVSDQYGYGMAIGTLLFIAMFIFAIVALRVLKPRT
jgi:raffinose/stachyose/melibiose transport system permease protein